MECSCRALKHSPPSLFPFDCLWNCCSETLSALCTWEIKLLIKFSIIFDDYWIVLWIFNQSFFFLYVAYTLYLITRGLYPIDVSLSSMFSNYLVTSLSSFMSLLLKHWSFCLRKRYAILIFQWKWKKQNYLIIIKNIFWSSGKEYRHTQLDNS